MSAMLRKRQPNFTSDEIEMLLNQVQTNSQMLFGKFNGVLSSAAKHKAWQAVATVVSSVSGVERSVREVKKKWSCLKYDAKTRPNASVLRMEGQPTGGCQNSNQLRAVMDLMGDVTVNGIATGIDTCDIIFSKPGKYTPV